MFRSTIAALCLIVLSASGCATVDVTKTSKGFFAPTNANDVEILQTKPERHFVELGAISTTGWKPSDTAKLHNALREKAAPLGASAVIVLQSGMVKDEWGGMRMWSNGVAIRYTDQGLVR